MVCPSGRPRVIAPASARPANKPNIDPYSAAMIALCANIRSMRLSGKLAELDARLAGYFRHLPLCEFPHACNVE